MPYTSTALFFLYKNKKRCCNPCIYNISKN
nr:MAG TPA_asm: hypothetical protein [Caudoviricetes sp.]